jgi:hypothetical protein
VPTVALLNSNGTDFVELAPDKTNLSTETVDKSVDKFFPTALNPTP